MQFFSVSSDWSLTTLKHCLYRVDQVDQSYRSGIDLLLLLTSCATWSVHNACRSRICEIYSSVSLISDKTVSHCANQWYPFFVEKNATYLAPPTCKLLQNKKKFFVFLQRYAFLTATSCRYVLFKWLAIKRHQFLALQRPRVSMPNIAGSHLLKCHPVMK